MLRSLRHLWNLRRWTDARLGASRRFRVGIVLSPPGVRPRYGRYLALVRLVDLLFLELLLQLIFYVAARVVLRSLRALDFANVQVFRHRAAGVPVRVNF